MFSEKENEKFFFFFENLIIQHASVVHWACFLASSHLVTQAIIEHIMSNLWKHYQGRKTIFRQ